MKSKKDVFLAIDLGASNGRAIAGYINNGKLITKEIYRFPNEPVNIRNTLYWNVFSIYQEIKNALKKYGEEFDCELSSIAIDSWGVDFGLLDRDGDLIEAPVHYRDDRTDGIREKAFEKMPREELFSRTGNQFLQFNTLFQLLSLNSNKKYQLDNAETFLMIGDLFSYLLTGRKATEFSLATTTQLFDPLEGEWSSEIFENFDLPQDIQPEVYKTGTEIGCLSKSLRKEVGIGGAPVIATTTHDTASAVSAIPARGEEWIFISSGTWSLLGIEIDEPILETKVMEKGFTNEGCHSGKFTLHKNLTGLWILQECKQKWDEQGKDLSYDQLTQMAREAKGFNYFIDTDWETFARPGNMPTKIKDYCKITNQQPPRNVAETVRGTLEGLALNYRLSVNQLKSITGKQFDTVHIVGGGAKNDLLSQFCANSTGLKVISGPREATAMGNIINQAVSIGSINSIKESRKIVSNSSALKTYFPKNVSKWDRAYQKFVEVKEIAPHDN